MENREVIIDGVKYVPEREEKEQAWPDSLEEALEITPYWGLLGNQRTHDRYFYDERVETFVNVDSVWCNGEQVNFYFENNGNDDIGNLYKIVPFDSKAELYLWLAEGEE